MTLRKREHPDAAAELDAAIDWYAEKRTRFGVEFFDAAAVDVDHILAYPHDRQRPGYWRRRLEA